MMHILIGIAIKSLFVAGLALGLLMLVKRRSAAERSWVAHIGLLALVIVAFAPLAMPTWNVEAPAVFGKTPAAGAPAAISTPAVSDSRPIAPALTAIVAKTAEPRPALSPTAVAMALYAVPAAILLFITALALARLIALRARADVLVDGHWLSALARAQRRMGFKHGTALLTSDELNSPISWGLMRPVILLNSRAVEASGEAEAIIAHELAHVARMDWAKLLLARVATALFWFNPLVWLLAREAHQLREEAADDAVLAADIRDTDYAQLLVGVARHECPGLLLGAHGVAPSKTSLARRVARVLDGRSVRGPAARPFALGVLVGAVLVAAPLAALTVAPAGSGKKAGAFARPTASPAAASAHDSPGHPVPPDLPSIIADGVSTAVSAVTPLSAAEEQRQARAAAIAQAVAEATRARDSALARASRTTADAKAAVRAHVLENIDIDRVVEMKTAGISPDYVAAMRAVSPQLRSLEPAEFAGLKAVGVTPEYARGLAAAGFRDLDADQLMQARAVGLTGDYARALAGAGIPLDIDDYIQLRAVSVPVSYLVSLRRSGVAVRDADQLTALWAVGANVQDLKTMPPAPPRPPKAPSRAHRPPAAPPEPPPPSDGPDPGG